GGIMTGLQAKHMLGLGAGAVQFGTAFVQGQTSNASAEYRKALFSKPVTQISACLSGRRARGILIHWHTKIHSPTRPVQPEYPY
ncbi:nitronate monooxygenase, partial [Acinetobacter baumannii]|nr:nitronate monooxygenase [Acinetobacter baumannii]